MKKKLLIFFVLIFTQILAFMFIYRYFYGEPPLSAKFEVYEKEYSNFFTKILRVIPEKYKDKIQEKNIQVFNNFKLILVSDLSYSPPKEYYLLNNNREIKFVSFPEIGMQEIRNFNEKEFLNGEYLTYFIDLKSFNEYIDAFYSYCNNDTIITKYCFFLFDSHDTNYCKLINKKEDLERILKIKFGNTIPRDTSKILNIDEIIFKKNAFYCWFFDKGLYEFNYKIREHRVCYIKSRFIGLLGNEIVPL